MPAHGGNRSLGDQDMARAVDFMLASVRSLNAMEPGARKNEGDECIWVQSTGANKRATRVASWNVQRC